MNVFRGVFTGNPWLENAHGIDIALLEAFSNQDMSREIRKFKISGEVISIREDNENFTVKIVCRPEYLLISTDLMEDFHLGDHVIIQGAYQIENVEAEM